MPVDEDVGIAFIRASRKRTLGFHLYETENYVYDSNDRLVPQEGVGVGVLVERPGWGSLWSWLDGVGRDDVTRLAAWLDRVGEGDTLQPRLDAGVDENISEPQVTFEHPELTSIRVRLRGDASPAKLLDEYKQADPPQESRSISPASAPTTFERRRISSGKA